MTFTAYIERQKNLIKSRHDSDTELYEGAYDMQSESEKLFDDLDSLKGLNTSERLNFTRKV
ncbi:MAG: hypothetical protein K2K60_05490 [Clostridia bacterium]|nr:hypothetical protein [Clostridia bacterium]